MCLVLPFLKDVQKVLVFLLHENWGNDRYKTKKYVPFWHYKTESINTPPDFLSFKAILSTHMPSGAVICYLPSSLLILGWQNQLYCQNQSAVD